MPAVGTKRTLAMSALMSAFGGKADIGPFRNARLNRYDASA
jgi:hypothetical protein